MSTYRANMLNEIVRCLELAGRAGMTRLEIASCLGVKRTPHLVGMINQVVEHGWASQAWDDSGRRAQYRYHYAQPQAVQ